MKIYISGPITGNEKFREQFNRAEEIIKGTGNEAINPASGSDWGLSWSMYMQLAKAIIDSGDVDAIYMLRGWDRSRGASRERFWAAARGIPVIYQDAKDEKKFREA